jgi:hypothetical protein
VQPRTLTNICKTFALAATWIATFSSPVFAASPQWLRDVAKAPLPTYDSETRGVTLLDEQITTVSDSGEVKTIYRMAYRVLNARGRDLGEIFVPFDNETKISNLHGWSLPAQGEEYELKDKDALETAMFSDAAYSDDRMKILRLPADVGSVIGFEYEQKQRPLLFRDTWVYQSDLPVLTARYTLNLPITWELETFWVRHPKSEPTRTGISFTWQETNVFPIKSEDNMPARGAVVPRLDVAFFPGGAKSTRAHTSWADVGSWYYQLANAKRQPTAEVQAATQKLLAGKNTFEEKLRALAAFAQRDVRYVAIEIGIGGYQPHDANSILANRYGDCKDKVTLMSAMLASAGIKSHYVVAETTRGVVAQEAPTVRSFNHAIIAIEVPKSEKLPASFHSVIDHSKLGKLLIFDPTNDLVPIGELPSYTQSNFGLLVLEQGGELIPLPPSAAERNGLVRTAKLTLSVDGSLTGQVREVRTGAQAAGKRSELLRLQAQDRRKSFENFLSSFLTGFTLKDFSIENLNDYDKELIVTYAFDATSYSKKMGPLMIVRPRVFGTKAEALDMRKERKFPFQLETASLQTDDFEITLPAGYTVDELPPPAELKNDALRYESQTSFEGQVLKYKRTYKVADTQFALEKIPELKKFYSGVMADERSSAVLKKQ